MLKFARLSLLLFLILYQVVDPFYLASKGAHARFAQTAKEGRNEGCASIKKSLRLGVFA
jgi:hypothetical protein